MKKKWNDLKDRKIVTKFKIKIFVKLINKGR